MAHGGCLFPNCYSASHFNKECSIIAFYLLNLSLEIDVKHLTEIELYQLTLKLQELLPLANKHKPLPELRLEVPGEELINGNVLLPGWRVLVLNLKCL